MLSEYNFQIFKNMATNIEWTLSQSIVQLIN